MILEPGTVIAGRFRLIRELGRGGMGSVWIAHHQSLEVDCAVKFISAEIATVPGALARFEREAKAAAQLKSPNVVQVHDFGVTQEGQAFIAMELLVGEDLGKRLERVGRLDPRSTHHIISEVARALSKAHAFGIVHRDLKPDNIFLAKDDDRELVKVLDFGIAKATTGDSFGNSTTRTGALLGSPNFMSPEQAQGNKTVDHRSDLWSLAVVAYECITGQLPFESTALGDLLMKIMVGPIPIPSQAAQVPPGFDAWWLKAASRNPDERFQSAREFASALGAALSLPTITDEFSLEAPGIAVPTRGRERPHTISATVEPRSDDFPVQKGAHPGGIIALSLFAALALIIAGVAALRPKDRPATAAYEQLAPTAAEMLPALSASATTPTATTAVATRSTEIPSATNPPPQQASKPTQAAAPAALRATNPKAVIPGPSPTPSPKSPTTPDPKAASPTTKSPLKSLPPEPTKTTPKRDDHDFGI